MPLRFSTYHPRPYGLRMLPISCPRGATIPGRSSRDAVPDAYPARARVDVILDHKFRREARALRISVTTL
jgi:hypothetical protein